MSQDNEAKRPGCLLGILKALIAALKPRLPYRARDRFLSPAELMFFRVLREALGPEWAICPKVRLGDLICVSGTSKSQAFRNRIDRKHIDFVLCDASTMTPRLLIELDDSSHSRQDRAERDRFVNAALDAAGLPIEHIRVQRNYALDDLRSRIAARLTSQQRDSKTKPQRV